MNAAHLFRIQAAGSTLPKAERNEEAGGIEEAAVDRRATPNGVVGQHFRTDIAVGSAIFRCAVFHQLLG